MTDLQSVNDEDADRCYRSQEKSNITKKSTEIDSQTVEKTHKKYDDETIIHGQTLIAHDEHHTTPHEVDFIDRTNQRIGNKMVKADHINSPLPELVTKVGKKDSRVTESTPKGQRRDIRSRGFLRTGPVRRMDNSSISPSLPSIPLMNKHLSTHANSSHPVNTLPPINVSCFVLRGRGRKVTYIGRMKRERV